MTGFINTLRNWQGACRPPILMAAAIVTCLLISSMAAASQCERPPVTDRPTIRLVLGGGGNSAPHGEVAEKALYLRLSHLVGVAFSVKENKPPDPGDVGLFCSITQVFDSGGHSNLVEKIGAPGCG